MNSKLVYPHDNCHRDNLTYIVSANLTDVLRVPKTSHFQHIARRTPLT